jgi:hypothetical protein
MPNPNIEDFMFKKNPQGSAYWTSIEGSFDCQECDEKVKSAIYQERTGEIRWQCSQKHESKASM